jgi:N-acetylmuramoyl-L-alanine amidase
MLPAPALAAPSGSHRVAPGETLSEIALRYGIRTAELARANSLGEPDLVYAGLVLTFPGSSSSGSSGGSSVSGGAGSHTVATGETLSEIALRYGVTVRALRAANDLNDPHRIVAGGRLELPTAVGAPASDGEQESVLHTVSPGQTLSGIAARYQVPAASIASLNGIRDRRHIVAGTTLRIPVTGKPEPGVASRNRVEELIESKARAFGYDPNLIKALAWQESGWNNGVVSSAGAVGIMQVLPETNRLVSQPRAGRQFDLNDPADNIDAGLHYLELLYELTGGDSERMLAGYYQGLRSVRENGRYPSTQRYIDNVFALWDRFKTTG